MSAFTPTGAQRDAIGLRRGPLLVSAAAGSGKTRVLVERLLSRITDEKNPRDIDSFLVITYTRAAAAELKSRILGALSALAAQNPENRRLRRQAVLCYTAPIGTVHSFCATLLRENAHLAGVAPDFSMLEEDRAAALKARALDRLLEAAYAHIEEDPGFRLLVDTVGAGRDDARLAGIVLELHAKLMSHPWPDLWVREQEAAMAPDPAAGAGETVWGRELLAAAKKSAAYWQKVMSALLAELSAGEEAAPILKAYGPSLAGTGAGLAALASALDRGWDAAREALPIPFPRLGALRNSPDEALSNLIKSRRDACKSDMAALEKTFSAPSEKLLAEMEHMRPAMEALLKLTLELDRAYGAEKRRQGVLDFSDLEHLALKLLADRETGAPTALAKTVAGRYTEILVDEYQDANRVQDLLFRAVSQDGQNLFMVGDVKQSIYRFRLADPGIFLRRLESSIDAGEAGGDTEKPVRVLLRENFRSRPQVLEAVNHVFRNIMSKDLGELDYGEAAALVPGAVFPDIGKIPPPALVLVPAPAPDGADGEAPGKTEAEAAFVAARIKSLVEGGALVSEGEKTRPVRYGDIVVLLRAPGACGAVFRKALADLGLPAEAERGADFFASPEVAAALSLLAVIDNPRQDVPLISALRAPVFGFSADELSQVRACGQSGDFYTALAASAEAMEKSRSFLALLGELRAAAPDLPVDGLLRLIFHRTGMAAAVSAMPDGELRRQNLLLLLDCAERFEENGYRGLFRFNLWLKRLMARGESPRGAAPSVPDAVRVMSIHKSKGLEFPVVFICDTDRRFNRQDTAGAVLVHAELGLGPKYTDPEKNAEWPTLARRAVARRIGLETLSEEMRVLYVAMTRAKERLFITCCLRDPEGTVEKLRDGLTGPIPPQLLESAASPARWLIRAALLPGSPLRLTPPESAEPGVEVPGGTAPVADAPGIETPPEGAEEAGYRALAAALDYRYPRAWAVTLPSKLTATEAKGTFVFAAPEGDEEAAAPLFGPGPEASVIREFRRPRFGAASEKALSAAERGTAAHLFLQYADLKAAAAPGGVRAEAARLALLGRLSPAQAEGLDVRMLEDFFSSELGRRVAAAERVLREFKFSLLCPAEDYFDVPPGETLLLQGVVDCAIEEAGAWTIVDYKTDRVFGEALAARADYYRPQLQTYAGALARITEKPVREAVLYFLAAGQAVTAVGGS